MRIPYTHLALQVGWIVHHIIFSIPVRDVQVLIHKFLFSWVILLIISDRLSEVCWRCNPHTCSIYGRIRCILLIYNFLDIFEICRL